MSAYLEHFGLSQPPFSKDIEDTDLWLPPSKQGLVDELDPCLRDNERFWRHAFSTRPV